MARALAPERRTRAMQQICPWASPVKATPVFIGAIAEAACCPSELAVVVLPLVSRQNLFDRVPVLGNLAVLDSKQVVKGDELLAELTLTDRKNEVPFAEDPADAVVLHGDASLGHGFQARAKTREAISDLGVVLSVPIASVIPGELIHSAVQDVLYER